MNAWLIAVYGLLGLAVFEPMLGVVICGALIALQVALLVLRPATAGIPARAFADPTDQPVPKFSIHVAIHSEPSGLVIHTLKSLLNQNWPADRYEIIVMDNNTVDESLWRPVEAFCACYPGRVFFLHRTGVRGAKAGALNIALEHTDPDVTHIITVDADYAVRRTFLSIAANALSRTGADYVQFPQSYSGTASTARGINAELEEYFRTNALVADHAEAVLLTGTLCVISKGALIAAGGWSAATITEDAEMGVRLCEAGFSGRFVNMVVGQGMLPLSLKDLEKQRYRWCSGNFQTLLKHLASVLGPNSSFNLHKRLVVVSQLTAWFNLSLVPCVLLLAWLANGRDQSVAASMAAGLILLSFGDVFLRIVGRGLRDGLPIGVMLEALTCRIALTPQSAKATFDAFCGINRSFVVTDKSGGRGSRERLHLCHLVLFVAVPSALIFTPSANPLILAALVALLLPLPAAWVTDKNLCAYRKAMIPSMKGMTA